MSRKEEQRGRRIYPVEEDMGLVDVSIEEIVVKFVVICAKTDYTSLVGLENKHARRFQA